MKLKKILYIICLILVCKVLLYCIMYTTMKQLNYVYNVEDYKFETDSTQYYSEWEYNCSSQYYTKWEDYIQAKTSKHKREIIIARHFKNQYYSLMLEAHAKHSEYSRKNLIK
jgi:hypothetical protein